MREINISRKLVEERHRKGIGQEELASYIGVSKAAVSKWENDQSYPDITLLPRLAAFFDISVDELIGYEPQMTREDIKELYRRLAGRFEKESFDLVLEECEEIIKKYYSCYPLLLQMITLLLNHAGIAEEPGPVLHKALEIIERVEKGSDDADERKTALTMRALCHLMLGHPEKVPEYIGEHVRPFSQDAELLAEAYRAQGRVGEAEEILQVCMYQHLLYLVGDAAVSIAGTSARDERIEEMIRRSVKLGELFQMESLHWNAMIQLYMSAIVYYAVTENKEEGLAMLERYGRCCYSPRFSPILHGDGYFNQIDGWLKEELELGIQAPRSEAMIKEAYLKGVTENPYLDRWRNEPRYRKVVEEMKKNLGGKTI